MGGPSVAATAIADVARVGEPGVRNVLYRRAQAPGVTELATGIDREPGKQGGEPCIAGTRVPVRRVGQLVDRHGAAPVTVADRYGRSLGEVHRALAYYYDRPELMAEHDRRDRNWESQFDDATDVEMYDDTLERLQHES